MNPIHDLLITPQKIIQVDEGDVFHALKSSEISYKGFGEAYFSSINPKSIKSWKRHNVMTLNLIVIIGKIRFVIFDDRDESPSKNSIYEIVLGPDTNYSRLTIPPGLWVAFQCLSDYKSVLLNVADIQHDPNEIDRLPLETFPFNWRNR
jgi:dTDP-4-dehydrorhamnose 3,5-epimerase